MKWIISSFIFMLAISSCSSSKVATFEEGDGAKLILSHGGGFAGKYKTYYILENGQVFKGQEEGGSKNEVKPLKKDVVDQIFSNYAVLGLSEIDINAYGNLNYSLTMIDENGKHKITWDEQQEGSDKLKLFYRNAMNHISINQREQLPSGNDELPKF